MSNWREMLKEAKELFDENLIDKRSYKKLMAEALALREQQTKVVLNKERLKPEMVLIPKGEFIMGNTFDPRPFQHEIPHKVCIGKDFLMSKYLVTQELWKFIMGHNPNRVIDKTHPVERISWFECLEFCNRLSSLEEFPPIYSFEQKKVYCNWEGKGYRLPTEAEWEYAARGGEDYIYSGSNDVDDVAWYSGNSGSQTHEVCGLQKNGYGLCDMSGNVYEWCWDWYDGSLYGTHADQGTVQDPYGANNGSTRVLRGGSWFRAARGTRVSNRRGRLPVFEDGALGFRLGRTP